MSTQKRNIIIFCFLTLSFIPFLLLTDLFPFMRFGMFAETLKENPQKELFCIEIEKADGTLEKLSQRQNAMDDGHLNYLTRTYYYQNKMTFLIDELLKSGFIKDKEHLVITQKRLTNNTWTTKIIARSK